MVSMIDQQGFVHVDAQASTDEQLAGYKFTLNQFIEHFKETIKNIDTELLLRMKRLGSTAIYGPEWPDGTPKFIAERKDNRGRYDRPQFQALAEIFTTAEYAECYEEPGDGMCKSCEGKGTVTHAEDWKTSKVKMYATKHGGKAKEIFDGAYQPGDYFVAIQWMLEGGEIDPDRS